MVTIAFTGWYDAKGREIDSPYGYNADDYLPDFASQEFPTQGDANAWIKAHHKGPDIEGIEARFVVLAPG